MKNQFRKKNRTQSEEMIKRASFQKSLGITGSELKRDFIVGSNGIRKEMGSQLKGIRVDKNGLPQVMVERYGKILDCGHIANSQSDIQGECYMGHTICVNDLLYICVLCGEILCDREVDWEEDEPVCPEHGGEIIRGKVIITALDMIGNTVKTFFGIE
jgi:hypothetical protein